MSDLIWHNEKRKVSSLIPYAKNPRQLTEKQAKDLAKSLDKFGLVDLPAINLDGILIGGHARCKILAMLGRAEEEIEVRVPSRALTDNEFAELNIRLNKNGGEFDFDALANNFDTELLLEAGFESGELGLAEEIEEISLPQGEKNFEQITFILSRDQAEKVRQAMHKACQLGEFVDTGNENKNGNAIARVCETYLCSK